MEIRTQNSSAQQRLSQEWATQKQATLGGADRGFFGVGRMQIFFDVCLAVMVFIATILMATAYDDQPLIGYSPTDLPLAATIIFAFASTVLLWRRRYPVLVLFAILLASAFAIYSGFFDGPLIATLIGLFGVGLYVERANHSISALLITLLFVGAVSMLEQASRGILWTFVQMLSVVLVWYVGRFVRVRAENKVLVQDQAKHEHARQASAAQQAVAQERTRIARDLHDIVAHHVSLMTIQAAAARTVASKDLPRAMEAMSAVEQVGREALNELRHLLGVLRLESDDEVLGPQPGLGDVARLVAQMRDAGLAIDLQIEGNPELLSKGTDLAAFRIIQEALTNVLKHAGAGANAKVRVMVGQNSTEITVDDNGNANSRHSGVGHGLLGMAERANLLGGTFSAGQQPSGGYKVRVCFPHVQKQQ